MEYFENKELKKSSIFVLLIGLGLIICLNIGLFAIRDEYKKAMVNIQSSFVGSMAGLGSDIEFEAVKAVTGGIKNESLEQGKAILSSYNYDDTISTELFNQNMLIDNNIVRYFNYASVCFIILFFICNYISHRKIYNKIKIIESWLNDLLHSKRKLEIKKAEDDDISRLYMSFNRVNNIIIDSFDTVQKEKGFLVELLSDISHQFKTPLSALVLNNEILLNKDMERAKALKFLESNDRQLIRMQGLIGNLLKLAKLDASAIEFKYKNTSIEQTLSLAIKSLAEIANSKNINIELIKNDSTNDFIYHDTFWLQEAFMNIIKNCIEHSTYGSKIIINISSHNMLTKIKVTDFGEGIDQTELPFVFKRFFKGKKKDSAGIGLNLAKTIIEGQGGHITVSSEKNIGTTFDVIFLKS